MTQKRTLNLALDASVSIVLAEVAPMLLTPFGKFARYLFCVAIENYARQIGDKENADQAYQYVKRSYDVIEPSMFYVVYRIPRSRASSSKFPVIPTPDHLVLMRNWFRDLIKDDPNVPVEEKDLFKRAMAFLMAGKDSTPSSLKSNERVAWQVSNYLGQLYNDVVRLGDKSHDKIVDTIGTLMDSAKRLSKKLTGSEKVRPDSSVSEKAKLDPRIAIDLTAYRGIVKKLKDQFDALLKKETSAGPVDVDKFAAKLEKMGFEILFFPTSKQGFIGRVGTINGKMTLYTTNGRALASNIPPEAKVKMNPKYNHETDDTYYASFRAPNAVTITSVYSAEFKGKSNEEKFKAVEGVTPSQVAKWIKAWQRDLKSKDPMKYVPACVAYVLYMTGARVGSSTESLSKLGKARTYGISTLRVEHAKVTTASIILDYNGKKGVQQRHVLKITDDPYFKYCARIIEDLKHGKKKDDLLFEFPRPNSRTGALQAVNPSFFKSYMTSVGYVGKVHALRHIRGTALVKELLESSNFTPEGKTLIARQKHADDFMKTKILTKAGELLGHKSASKGVMVTAWRTSIQSYVNPKVVADWYLHNRLVVPKWVPKKLED